MVNRISLSFIIVAFAWVARGDTPAIIVGVDAQPMGNFDRVAAIGNTLVRYDPGPQKADTLDSFLTLARIKKLRAIPQGTAAERQGLDLTKFADVIVAVGQDDEPDMNRYPSLKWPQVWTPETAPHSAVIGWANWQPPNDVLGNRYKAWKAKWPAYPVQVNFNGKSLTSLYYTPALANHANYCAASDGQTFDGYPFNNGYNLYQSVPYVYDKLAAAVGRPVGGYVECSDQSLDGDENGGNFRGPTPNEQGTILWSLIGHGAREVTYFPQRIGKNGSPGFQYWAMKPENEARAKADWVLVSKYMNLLATGTRAMTVQDPPCVVDYKKGTAVWPKAETFRWDGKGESLTLSLDYVDGKAPVIKYEGEPAPPEPGPTPPTPGEIELAKQLAAANAKLAKSQSDLEAANAALATATEKLDAATAVAGNQEATIRAAAAQTEALGKTLATPPPTTRPASDGSAIYLTVPAPEGTNFRPYAWGHAGIINSVVDPAHGVGIVSESPYDWTESRIRAYARICRDGGTVDQRWIAGAGVVVIAAGSPVAIDVEGYGDPAKKGRPDLDKAKAAQIFRRYVLWAKDEVKGKCPVGLLALPYYDGPDDDGAVYRPAHEACDFVCPPDTYTNGPQWVDRDNAIAEAASVRVRALYPDKPQHIWLNPLYADAGSTEKTPEVGAREALHARAIAGAGGLVVVWTPRDPAAAARVFGGVAAAR